MVEREEAAFEFLVAHQQFAKAIEPTMTDLDDPTPGLFLRLTPLELNLRASIGHVRDVSMRLDDGARRLAAVADIGAQVPAAPMRGGRTFEPDRSHYRFQPRNVIHVGCGHDERQRDATAVDQQVSLAATFPPDRSGWARPLPAPWGP